MSPKMCQMESVRLAINEHMTSVVGEDILCVLEKQQRDNKACCCVSVVRVFVLERLSAAAGWMCNLFQREMETLETLLDHQSKLLDMAFNVDTHTAEVPEGRSSSLQQEAGSEDQEVMLGGPEKADVTTTLLLQKKTCDLQDLPACKEEQEEVQLKGLSSERLEGVSSLLQEDVQLKGLSSEHVEDDAVPPATPPIPVAAEQRPPSLPVKSEDEEEKPFGWNRTSPEEEKLEEKPFSWNEEEEEKPFGWNPSSNEEEKPFSCMFCCKSFNLNGNLKRHMRIHTGERPFACTTCDKRFGEKKDLHRHMRTHTGEKPFACAVCSKRFSESSSLKTHMTIHTGEKRFVCTVCGKGWCKKDDLTKHMRIHTGEKPFMCTVCSRCFSRGETLKKHVRTHR